ncbi:hypothetical protein FRB95_005884 [Tulasnella sp. JGI-2019a]|nr:hypothetical protein FRB93_005927 [Tulasnella sp. JGI-2019a]KAG9028932.1 hypothetical protein FRB95_005884 [Tulasnella sp. JGI-2019a]
MSMTDSIGSLTVATRGQWMTGVSTDIATTFARPAGKIGDTLHIKGSLVSMGKTLAFTRIDFSDSNGKIVAYGHHTKYIASTLNHEKNVKFSADGETVIEGKEEDD